MHGNNVVCAFLNMASRTARSVDMCEVSLNLMKDPEFYLDIDERDIITQCLINNFIVPFIEDMTEDSSVEMKIKIIEAFCTQSYARQDALINILSKSGVILNSLDLFNEIYKRTWTPNEKKFVSRFVGAMRIGARERHELNAMLDWLAPEDYFKLNLRKMHFNDLDIKSSK